MFNFLDRLRNESEVHRKRTAIIVAFSLTGIVIIGWLMSVSASSHYSYTNAEGTSSTSPTTAVKDALSTGVGMLKELMNTFSQTKTILFNAASSSIASSTPQ